jgi:hypothetical protein
MKLGNFYGPVVQDLQLVRAQGQTGVRMSFVVDELDFGNVWGKPFDSRANLAPKQPLMGQVFGQSDDF